MVKGVHKKIIEIKATGSDYFEKAVFYLRPEVTQLPPQISETAAQMMLREFEEHSEPKPLWKRLVFGAGACALIAAISVCAILLR